MKKMIILLILSVLLIGCYQQGSNPATGDNNATAGGGAQTGGGSSGSGGASGAGSTTVRISGFAFDPAELTVKQGDTVVWVNEDSVPHTIKMGSAFESSQMGKGDSAEHTFTETPGEYPYSCAIHPSMHGKIIVVAG